jgi:hypothetical protein
MGYERETRVTKPAINLNQPNMKTKEKTLSIEIPVSLLEDAHRLLDDAQVLLKKQDAEIKKLRKQVRDIKKAQDLEI